MDIHEICSIFPMMSPEEFAGLKSDIAAHGQREPIWTHGGKVIDGRNRLRACEELDIEPVIEEWDGEGSLIEFIVSLNLHRRHLTSSQRAACGTEIEERLAVEAKERQRAAGGDHGNQYTKRDRNWQSDLWAVDQERKKEVAVRERCPEPPKSESRPRDQAAKLVGTNHRYIQDAKTVKAASPELHEKVKAGTITLPQAKREVHRAEKRDELAAKAEAVADDDPTSSWEIIEGDCIEELERLKGQLYQNFTDPGWESKGRTGNVRLVFADPPYNIGVDYGEHHSDSMPEGEYLDWCRKWMVAAAGTLTPDGSMWVLINHEWAADFEIILRDEAGLTIVNWITWFESFGVNCARRFNRCSRRLFHAVRNPRDFVFNADVVTRPSDRQAKYGDKRADLGGKLWDDVWGINPPIPRLVDNASERIPDFPTQLPISLLRAIVGCASDPGDLIVDPFNGSGTTGAVAIELGRRYLGIEKSKVFIRLARQRLKITKGEFVNG